VGTEGLIQRTTDGLSWLPQKTLIRWALNDVFFMGPLTGWAVGENGSILHTSDGGGTWSLQASGTKNVLLGVAFTSALTGWAVGFGGTILHTTDGGASWVPVIPQDVVPITTWQF
jgi:photosystem II stability/assembly factor-like uncharacterized protein